MSPDYLPVKYLRTLFDLLQRSGVDPGARSCFSPVPTCQVSVQSKSKPSVKIRRLATSPFQLMTAFQSFIVLIFDILIVHNFV